MKLVKNELSSRGSAILLGVVLLLMFLLFSAAAENPGIGLAMMLPMLLVILPVGWLIGRSKGRVWDGLLWSVLLGPLGWLIVALSTGKGVAHPRCPECLSRVHTGARRCCHCGAVLSQPS